MKQKKLRRLEKKLIILIQKNELISKKSPFDIWGDFFIESFDPPKNSLELMDTYVVDCRLQETIELLNDIIKNINILLEKCQNETAVLE